MLTAFATSPLCDEHEVPIVLGGRRAVALWILHMGHPGCFAAECLPSVARVANPRTSVGFPIPIPRMGRYHVSFPGMKTPKWHVFAKGKQTSIWLEVLVNVLTAYP